MPDESERLARREVESYDNLSMIPADHFMPIESERPARREAEG